LAKLRDTVGDVGKGVVTGLLTALVKSHTGIGLPALSAAPAAHRCLKPLPLFGVLAHGLGGDRRRVVCQPVVALELQRAISATIAATRDSSLERSTAVDQDQEEDLAA
jgi:hypothetical protein